MTLIVRLLGPVQISRDEQPISVRGYKPVALLAYLLVTGKAHTRQHLVDLLFDGPDDPKASLRWTLSELRRAIGAEYILADRQQIVFNFEGDYWLDVIDFEAGQSNLYRSDFLEGLNVRDAFGFEEWTLFERERLKGIYQAALTRRLETGESGGDDQAVIETAQRLLRLDNLREGWYRALMRAYARQGQREAALAQFELCRQVLKTELGVEPGTETVDLAEAIRQGTIETTQDFSRTSLPARPPAPLHTLRVPPQPTPFIGREVELTALGDLIADPNVRLVTIVGLGGMGKTRLALALAEELVGSEQQLIRTATDRSSPGAEPTLLFSNGVFFVSLAPLSGVDQIVPTIAQALDFRLETGRTGGLTRTPQQQLLDYLHQKRLLLIMDNLEHLLSPPSEGEENGGAELLAEILQTAPGVQILATSRDLSDLSLAAHGLGNISEAKQGAYEALQIAAVTPTAVPAIGHAIAIFAYLLANEGHKEEAVELYALASRYAYVGNSRWFEDVIGQHITAAAATLPPEIVEAAQAQGQALDLRRTVAELLRTLSERGWGEAPHSGE